MIQLKDITVLRGKRKLFENFNFTVHPDEHWVIQGDNGSGKTSLLQIIAGILHPTSGEVRYSFIEANDWDALHTQRQDKLRLIPTHSLQTFLHSYGGLFYQQRYYSMYNTPLRTVQDVFQDDIKKLKALDLSESFDISPILGIELTRLSNGQLKKVLIISHLIKTLPRFLLLDYPFDGLDIASRHDLSAFLADIASRFKIQIIIVDHDHELPSVINRRMILKDFKIEKTETISVPEIHNYSITKPEPDKKKESLEAKAPVVEMRNLTIQYSGKKIIENLNWRINKGERWALTGKNGSGKTTLFSLIYADHPMAYSQQVFLFGRRRGSGESIWDIKKRINYLGPEQIHFLDMHGTTLSAWEYISGQRSNVDEALNALADFFGAKKFIDQPVKSLSSGQLQIMLLIMFFLQEKELLLLDEPFQFLDPETKEKTTRYLTNYLHKDVTLVLITHNENDVRSWTKLRKEL